MRVEDFETTALRSGTVKRGGSEDKSSPRRRGRLAKRPECLPGEGLRKKGGVELRGESPRRESKVDAGLDMACEPPPREEDGVQEVERR